MPVELPLEPSLPHYSFSTVLAEEVFELNVRWNGRDAAWYMDIADASGGVIRTGIKLVIGSTLGRASADPRFPKGVFNAYDTSGARRDAGFDDMGTRVKIVFWAWDEIPAPVTT